MSGPTTVLTHPHQALPLLLTAAALRAAQDLAQARQAAQQLRHTHTQARQAENQRQAQAEQQGLAALQAQARAAEQRLAQLQALCQQLGGGAALTQACPQPPQAGSHYLAWANYVSALHAFEPQARQALMTVAASQPPGDTPAHQALSAFAQADTQADISIHTPIHTSIDSSADTPAQPAAPPSAPPSARLLARVAHLGPVPEDMAALAAELDAATDPTRAELLTSELRLHIQRHAQQHLQAQLQAAQALVLQQSLHELGYQVEGIESTLFVEGGVAHFRKPHWGDYMVRLRADAQGQSLNFNVVRAVDTASAAAADTSASVQDHLAEDRWCAEFPALMQAMATHGVRWQVARQLQAGELPVQRVARQQLPAFADEQPLPAAAAPRQARPLP